MDINSLPYLNFDLYDVKPDSLKSISCETGRGCPYKCTFCSTTTFWGNRFRVKDPERVAKEIAHYCLRYVEISHFDFHSHDNFLTNKDYIKKLFIEFEKHNLKITWNCSSRIDQLDDEFIKVLKKTGCNYIDCGPESGSPRIRKLIKKDIDYEKTRINIKKLLLNQIGVAVNFMIGFPTETTDELEMTFEEACTCDGLEADIVFCFLSPIKGTKIYEEFESLLMNKNEEHIHDFTDTRANYLYGTDKFRSEHPFFKNQVKMFGNDKNYNHIVEKIRKSDSVHIFNYLSELLLGLKHNFAIDIYKTKAALSKFPYTEDLFNFAVNQAKKNSVSIQTVISILCNTIQGRKKGKDNQQSQFEDITMFICFDKVLDQENITISKEHRSFITHHLNEFFQRHTGSYRYPILKEINNFKLDSAFILKPLKKLFMKFTNDSSSESILTSISLNGEGINNILYYKKQPSNTEIKFLKSLEKIVSGETNA